MDEPLVSVIVPVYNAAGYLPKCVASIQAQTYSNWELILVNDGSTDGSGQICDALAREDSRLHIIHQENGGVSSARNTGLDAAEGTYIYFVDSDDWVAETMLAETVAIMQRESCDICTWEYWLADAGGEIYSGRWKEQMFRFAGRAEKQRFLCRWILPGHLYWSVCNRVFRQEIIQQNSLRFAVEQVIAEDFDFLFRYLANCRNMYYIPEALYTYRQHPASAMHTTTLQAQASEFLNMVRRQDRTLSDWPLFQPFYAYGGTILVVLLDAFVEKQPLEQGLAQAVACFRKCPEWNYLVEQARLAVRDKENLWRICGYRLEGRVYGFYHYLLTGDAVPYRRVDRLRKVYNMLRTLKKRTLYV